MKRSVTFSLLTIAVLLMGPMIISITASQQDSRFDHPSAYTALSLPLAPEAGKFTLYEENGEVGCRETTAEEVEIETTRV